MKNIKQIIKLSALAMVLIGCSESLEDTYSEYAGDGRIRYIAKCSEFSARSGWERLFIDWKNGTDATIDKIKIVWSAEGLRDSILLPAGTTAYTLESLEDVVYRLDISALNASGQESLKETTYGRPYTRSHEVMRAFSRGVVKAYFLKNKMVFFSDKWNESIVEMKLEYKDTEGNTQYYEFTENSYGKLITINNFSMNPEDKIYILRKGRPGDCDDIIVFDPYEISRKKNFSSGFINAIERRYGYSTETKEQEAEFENFINTVETLEFDYNIDSFEDILYCPNLKKLIFGKNRYLNNNFHTNADKSLLLGNSANSKLILDAANNILGMTIDCYGNSNAKHYFSYLRYMTHKGYSVMPTIEVLSPNNFVEVENGELISCTPSDPYDKLNQLLDDNPASIWVQTGSNRVRYYDMTMQLKAETEIRGIKVAQYLFNPESDAFASYFMPTSISVQTSTNGSYWEDATYFTANELGNGSGEVTLLEFPKGPRKVLYVKISLRDGMDNGGICMLKLGDIVLYK